LFLVWFIDKTKWRWKGGPGQSFWHRNRCSWQSYISFEWQSRQKHSFSQSMSVRS
jgi:hypothetical protein